MVKRQVKSKIRRFPQKSSFERIFKRSAAVVVFSADLLRKTTALLFELLCPFDNDIRLLISVVRDDPRVWVVGVVRAADFRFSGHYRPPANRRARIFRPRSAIVSRFSARPGGLTDCLFAHMSVYRARDQVKRRAGQGNTRSSVLVTAVTACSNVRPPWT